MHLIFLSTSVALFSHFLICEKNPIIQSINEIWLNRMETWDTGKWQLGWQHLSLSRLQVLLKLSVLMNY